MNIDLMAGGIGLILGLISVYLGIYIVIRSSGKLRSCVLFLFATVIVFILKEVLKNIYPIYSIESAIIRGCGNILISLFILLATIKMREIIRQCNGNSNKRKKE